MGGYGNQKEGWDGNDCPAGKDSSATSNMQSGYRRTQRIPCQVPRKVTVSGLTDFLYKRQRAMLVVQPKLWKDDWYLEYRAQDVRVRKRRERRERGRGTELCRFERSI